MQESTLLRICLLCSIIGIILLYFIAQHVKFPEGNLLEEDKSYVVKGTIGRITQIEKVTFIDLQKEDELTVVLFKNYPVDLHAGDYVEIIGKASKDDKGEIQLIGNEVRVIK